MDNEERDKNLLKRVPGTILLILILVVYFNSCLILGMQKVKDDIREVKLNIYSCTSQPVED